MLEHRNDFKAVAFSFFFTPVPGGLVASLVEDLGIGVSAQHFGIALLPDKRVPKHNQIYMASVKAMAADLAFEIEGSRRNVALGICRMIDGIRLLVDRALDNLDPEEPAEYVVKP